MSIIEILTNSNCDNAWIESQPSKNNPIYQPKHNYNFIVMLLREIEELRKQIKEKSKNREPSIFKE